MDKETLLQLQELVDGHIAIDENKKLVPTEAKITITDIQAEALGGVEVAEPASDLGNAYIVPVSLLVQRVRPEYWPPASEPVAESTEADPAKTITNKKK